MNTILLVNDDGVQSDGLHSLRDGLIEAGHRVVTVAPGIPRSGTSRSSTFRNPVKLTLVGGDGVNPIYACDGTPTDCTRATLLADLGDGIDLVLSGINEGGNLGDDATYSSTVGAALEGALLGVPAISISQQSRDGLFRLVDLTGYDWDYGVAVTVWLTEAVLASGLPERTIINVNIPGQLAEEPVATVTRLGRRAWKRGSLRETGEGELRGYYTFAVPDGESAPYVKEDGTDFAALEAGNVSLTPISVNWPDREARQQLTTWLESLIDGSPLPTLSPRAR